MYKNLHKINICPEICEQSKYGGTSRAISSLAATLHLGRVQKYTPSGSALQNSTLPHAVSTGGKL